MAAQCVSPRAAGTVNPFTGAAYDDKQGSQLTENEWIRDYVQDTYLWYADVPAVDPQTYVIGVTVPYVNPTNNVASTETPTTDYQVVDAYFNSQRSPLTTDSGKPKDQFHFTYVTTQYVAIEQTGAVAGYGFTSDVIAAYPPRDVVVAFTDAGTPAANASIGRGAEIVTVDGVDVVNGSDVATINAALFSPTAGQTHTFGILDYGATSVRNVTLAASVLPENPVQLTGTLPAPNANVGYMLFNEHIATAEQDLIDAVNTLNASNGGAGVTELVLDMRYNGGGLLDIASELASMISSTAQTSGHTFERETFNAKNPFGLSAAQSTTPFYEVAQGYSATAGSALPHLNLSRVFVITTGSTCSASEAVMNGLKGIGVPVIQIGSTTCGKPYGFFPQDNCSTTFFTIQFEGVNDAGFGAYADGFIPAGAGSTANNLPGCQVADDFGHALGDPAEANLAAALGYMNGGVCPASVAHRMNLPRGLITGTARVARPELLENRIVHLERLKQRPF